MSWINLKYEMPRQVKEMSLIDILQKKGNEPIKVADKAEFYEQQFYRQRLITYIRHRDYKKKYKEMNKVEQEKYISLYMYNLML